MASVDLKLPIAYVENVTRFKVVTGTDLSLTLKVSAEAGDYIGTVDYASTGDPVLEITPGVVDTTVDIKALSVGLARFFFIQKADSGIAPIKEIRIEVTEEILDPAADLGATGELIPKVE
jgi:hypothetical protein